MLATSEESVLNKSLNFSVIIKWITYLDLIADWWGNLENS